METLIKTEKSFLNQYDLPEHFNEIIKKYYRRN